MSLHGYFHWSSATKVHRDNIQVISIDRNHRMWQRDYGIIMSQYILNLNLKNMLCLCILQHIS